MPPTNDDFANATVISGGSGAVAGSNVGATSESAEPVPEAGSGTNTVWWEWTAPADGNYQFSLAGSDFDTVLEVYTGSTLSGLSLVDFNDDGPIDLTSELTIAATAGTTYRIRVHGYSNSDEGSVSLAWSTAAPGLPDVQGLANYVVTNHHLIRGDRMSFFGDNLADATALSVGGHSCAILGTTSGDYGGSDTLTFVVPATLRPNRADGTVSVSVTNPAGTGGDSWPFRVARPGDWIQPEDVPSTTRVLPEDMESNNVADTDPTTVIAELTDTATGWASTSGHFPFEPLAELDFQSNFAFAGDTWAAYTLQSLWAVDAANWTRTEHNPMFEYPDGAIGFEYEGADQQEWDATGTVNYPATITMPLWQTEVAAEKFRATEGWTDNSTYDDPAGWFLGAALEARALPAGPDAPISPAAAAAADLLGSVDLEPLVTAGSPARSFAFEVAEDQLRFALLFDWWATEDWPGFPPLPADGDYGHAFADYYPNRRRHLAVAIDESGIVGVAYRFAATTYTPRRYRFIYEVPAALVYVRQRQAGSPVRQRQRADRPERQRQNRR